MRYQRKPVDAFRWSGSDAQLHGIDWLTDKDRARMQVLAGGYLDLQNLTGNSVAAPGYWVVKDELGLQAYTHAAFCTFFVEVPENG